MLPDTLDDTHMDISTRLAPTPRILILFCFTAQLSTGSASLRGTNGASPAVSGHSTEQVWNHHGSVSSVGSHCSRFNSEQISLVSSTSITWLLSYPNTIDLHRYMHSTTLAPSRFLWYRFSTMFSPGSIKGWGRKLEQRVLRAGMSS